MWKKKIYEIGKELDLDNKEIIEYAKTLNPDIKGHLSSVTDDEYKNIINHFSKGASKTAAKTKKAEPQPKEPVKTTGQVIIRREVIVKDERRAPVSEVKKVDKTGIGFNQVRNKDYNIVYRNKENKPLTITKDSSKNIMKVYYVSDAKITTKYIDKETGKEIADSKTENTKIGEKYNEKNV